MSSLRFDGINLKLQLYSDSWELLGEWPANNRVAHSAKMRFIPNGRYAMEDKTHTKTHTRSKDSTKGSFGPYGILRLAAFRIAGHRKPHDGVGVHSGRNNNPNSATMGCIRTTDDAMNNITQHIKDDPLLFIVVQNNFDHNPTGRAAQHGHGHHHSRAHHNGTHHAHS